MDHAGVSAPIPSYRIYDWMTLTKMWVPICLYCSNCTKFGQLIFRKIVKIVATRCQILWQMHQIRFRSLQRSPRPLAAFGGPTSKGRGREEGRKGWGKGSEVGREGNGRGLSLSKVNFLVTSLVFNTTVKKKCMAVFSGVCVRHVQSILDVVSELAEQNNSFKCRERTRHSIPHPISSVDAQ